MQHILIGIAVLLGFFGLVYALDALLDHLLLKAALAVVNWVPRAFRKRYRSASDGDRYDHFRPKRKIP